MISASQIRAARALLGWSQQQVAEAVQMTTAALSRIESSQTRGRASTLQRIEAVFTQTGIDFLSDNGVQLRQRSVGIVEHDGEDAVQNMQNDLYIAMLAKEETTMYLNGVDERKFMQANSDHLLKTQKRLKKSGFKQEILIQNNDSYFVMPPEVATYRWVSSELFGLIPTIIYANKVAIIFWGPPTQVVIMESKALAETYRKQFKALWRLATPVPFSPREIREICKENYGS